MMKVELVNPPKTFIDRSEIAPPLGLLRLAGAGRSAGCSMSISDFNVLYHTDDWYANSDDFYTHATDYLLKKDAEVYCFTSMAVDTHVAIHLARLLKKKRSDVIIVVGGTHFSSIADAVIEKFPWIDFVVTGEGENFVQNLPTFVKENRPRQVISGSPLNSSENGELPFDLVNLELYFSVNPNRCLDFETGRGCRFKCAFCYSPTHYKGFRNFSIDNTISGLQNAYELGFRNVFFVEDNFLNDSVRAAQLCRDIENADLDIAWQAYTTFPQLTPDIISLMARAGCTAVFAGIDAVGKESRRAHKKAFVREVGVLRERIRECVANGITPTCAFLLSPPSHVGGGDIDETLYFALAARNAGAHVRLNTLTLYNQTGSLANALHIPEYDGFKVQLMLDVPEVVEENFYAVENPELFPFHSRYIRSSGEWHNFVSLVHNLFTLFEAYPRTLEILWESEGIKPIHIAEKMLDNTGPLLAISKSARRDAQLLEAVNILESIAVRKVALQPILEMESSRFLVFN
jgi:hypothetical protein